MKIIFLWKTLEGIKIIENIRLLIFKSIIGTSHNVLYVNMAMVLPYCSKDCNCHNAFDIVQLIFKADILNEQRLHIE